MHKTTIVLNFILFMLLACSPNSIEPVDYDSYVRIISIEPSGKLKIGEKIKVVFERIHLDSASFSNHQYMNDLWYVADAVQGDTLYSYVPYIPTDDSVWTYRSKLNTYFNNEHIHYDVFDTLYVQPENCYDSVCIKMSDLDMITEQEANYQAQYYDHSKWTGTISEDTLTISRITPGHDESHYVTSIKLFDQGSNRLPIFLEATKIEYGQWVSVNDTLKQGIIKIQNWDTAGIVSGVLLAAIKPFNENAFFPDKQVFWVDFSE